MLTTQKKDGVVSVEPRRLEHEDDTDNAYHSLHNTAFLEFAEEENGHRDMQMVEVGACWTRRELSAAEFIAMWDAAAHLVSCKGLTCGNCAKKHGVPCDPEGKKKAKNAINNPKNSAKNSAKVSAKKRQAAIEFKLATAGDTIDLSDPALEAAGLQCIQRIEQRIEECKEAHPEGFMIMIYGTSTGSLSIVHAPRRGSGNPPAACGTFRSLPRC